MNLIKELQQDGIDRRSVRIRQGDPRNGLIRLYGPPNVVRSYPDMHAARIQQPEFDKAREGQTEMFSGESDGLMHCGEIHLLEYKGGQNRQRQPLGTTVTFAHDHCVAHGPELSIRKEL